MSHSYPFSPTRKAVARASFSNLSRYWNEPGYRERCDMERRQQQAATTRSIDEFLIAQGNRWPAHWSDADKAEMTAKLLARQGEGA